MFNGFEIKTEVWFTFFKVGLLRAPPLPLSLLFNILFIQFNKRKAYSFCLLL